MSLRVLHIWNTAGVASILAKYQARLLGWKTWVITRKKHDPFGHTVYGEAIGSSVVLFYLRTIAAARSYDIIHIHDIDKLVPLLKRLYPGKKIVLHYHGSSIRGKWKQREKYWKQADLVVVATHDLLKDAPEGIGYVPNPVDTELFRPLNDVKRDPKAALYIYDNDPRYKKRLSYAERIARKLGLKLTTINRSVNPVRYTDMPRLLNRYSYYIDHTWLPALSKTALEALACGLRVFRWDGNLIEGLPREHHPENVVRMWEKLYFQL